MDDNTKAKLKSIELDLLTHFIAVCEKHNLTYFCCGGTCLGAVRHKGFIPWDDDVDVAMPRQDYEVFLKVAQQDLPDYIFLQWGKTDPNYPANFAKLRNSNTTFVETSVADFQIHHGVYLDIFPLDGANTSKWFKIKDFLYKRIVYMEYNIPEVQPASLKGKALNFVLRALRIDYRWARDKREALIQKKPYANSGIIINYSGAWGAREYMPRAFMGEGAEATFEGVAVKLPQQWDKYLTHLYGDYMTPPPVEKQVGHHYCSVIDLEKSYKHYMENRA